MFIYTTVYHNPVSNLSEGTITFSNIFIHKINQQNSKVVLDLELALCTTILTDVSLAKYNPSMQTIHDMEKTWQNILRNNDSFLGYYSIWKKVDYTNQYEVIGLIHIYALENDNNISFAFWVLPLHQRKGYGTQIVKFIINHCKSIRKYKKLEALVHINNIPSNKIMQHNGFTLVEKNKLIRGFVANKYILNL